MNGMNFISRNGIKALVALVGISVVGILAQRYVAASPSKLAKVDSRPRVQVEHPRRVTVVQRLQTNATLAAFEEADLFAKVSDTCPMFASNRRSREGGSSARGDRHPRNGAGACRGPGQLASKQSSLETARHEVDHQKRT